MSARDDGFAIADVATDLYSDPKVKALARRLRDPMLTLAHMALYEALLLESWGEGERITLEDAVPAWVIEPVDDMAANLVAVGLIGEDTRIPEASWVTWFTPAYERREKRRKSGAIGGRSHGKGTPKQTDSDAQATLNPSVRPSDKPSYHARESAEEHAGTTPAYRRSQRQHAYNRGAITEAQHREMNLRDAPLDEIPDYAEHVARLAAEVTA